MRIIFKDTSTGQKIMLWVKSNGSIYGRKRFYKVGRYNREKNELVIYTNWLKREYA